MAFENIVRKNKEPSLFCFSHNVFFSNKKKNFYMFSHILNGRLQRFEFRHIQNVSFSKELNHDS